MVPTFGWEKDVASFVRKADVACIAEVDDVAAFYAEDQEDIVSILTQWLAGDEGVIREDVEHLIEGMLGWYGGSRQKMKDITDSICSRLGIALEEVVCSG